MVSLSLSQTLTGWPTRALQHVFSYFFFLSRILLPGFFQYPVTRTSAHAWASAPAAGLGQFGLWRAIANACVPETCPKRRKRRRSFTSGLPGNFPRRHNILWATSPLARAMPSHQKVVKPALLWPLWCASPTPITSSDPPDLRVLLSGGLGKLSPSRTALHTHYGPQQAI